MLRYMDTEAPIVAPLYRGEKGSPVLFDRSLFNELFMVEGDRGGRDLLNKYPVEYVNFDSSVPGMDIDTPEDYEKVSKLRNTKYDIR